MTEQLGNHARKEIEATELPKWIDQITSNEEYTVYLHRTRSESAQSICEGGFRVGLTLTGTATPTSLEAQRTFDIFKMIHHAPGVAVILRVPQRLRDEVAHNREQNILKGKESPSRSFQDMMDSDDNLPDSLDDLLFEQFFDPQQRTVLFPREWIAGYADQTTLEFTPNPHYDPDLKDPVKS